MYNKDTHLHFCKHPLHHNGKIYSTHSKPWELYSSSNRLCDSPTTLRIPPILKLIPRHTQNRRDPNKYYLCTNKFPDPHKIMGTLDYFGNNPWSPLINVVESLYSLHCQFCQAPLPLVFSIQQKHSSSICLPPLHTVLIF